MSTVTEQGNRSAVLSSNLRGDSHVSVQLLGGFRVLFQQIFIIHKLKANDVRTEAVVC